MCWALKMGWASYDDDDDNVNVHRPVLNNCDEPERPTEEAVT